MRPPARATSEAHRASVVAGRTAKMVVFDRVLRPAPATASARPAEVVAWALGASVSLAALTSLASAATWALLFPHL